MKFNDTALSNVKDGLEKEFTKHINDLETFIQQTTIEKTLEDLKNRYAFLNREIKNIDIISRNIIQFIQQSKVDEIVCDEDKNDVNLIFKGRHKYILENSKKEIIADFIFDGSYIDKINDISKLNFRYRIFKYVPNHKRNKNILELYKNKRNIKLEKNVEKSIRIIKSFYNIMDLGLFSGYINYSLEIKDSNIKIPHINLSNEPEIFSKIMYENQSSREFFYENFKSYFKNIETFKEFEDFMNFKKFLDKFLNANNVKTKGLQTSCGTRIWSLKDEDYYDSQKGQSAIFYYELENHYVKLNEEFNGSTINFFIKVEQYSIKEFNESFIYLENNQKTDYKFKDFLRNKKEVLGYIQLINY